MPTQRNPMDEETDYRQALGKFATGVAVLAMASACGKPAGLTINSFNSISLTPRLVAWSLRREGRLTRDFLAADYVAINVLSASQMDLAHRFAGAQRYCFSDLDWHAGIGGVPLLDACCATFEVRCTSRYEEGDHVLCIGEVQRFTQRLHRPLIYLAGQFHEVASIQA